MKTFVISLTVFFTATLLVTPSFAQQTAPSPVATPAVATRSAAAPGESPSAADMEKMMQQMMELQKPGENQKLLASLAGPWSYTIKLWMNPDPNAKPTESKGTAVTKPMMGGRYFVTDVSGKMKMPGPDGKMKDTEFKGMGIDGYDNVEQKFVSSWIDNMSTGIMISKGDYDPATKTFTYTTEAEMTPGMKTKIREVIKIVDNDHHTFEWYEDRGTGPEAKTMEISYTRKK